MNLFHTFAKTTMLAALASASFLACSGGSGKAGDTSLGGNDVPPYSTEYPTISNEPGPGQAATFGLTCPASYSCLTSGSSKPSTLTLVSKGGACTDGKFIIFSADGTFVINGSSAGTWSASGNGFSTAATKNTTTTTVECTRIAGTVVPVPTGTAMTDDTPPVIKDAGTKDAK